MPDQPEPIPPDDLSRTLTIARPDEDQSLPHIGLVGDTYTILVAGKDTAGKYTLIDMHVPPGGGPPPHRHNFEEMFSVLDGQVRVTFRGETIVASPARPSTSGQRAALVHQRLGHARAAAVPVRAGRAGRVLHPGRPASHHPDRAAATARHRRPGGLHREVDEPGPEVQDRAAAARPRDGTQPGMSRRVQFDRYGPADVLQVADVPRPQAGEGQVLVQVVAAGINPGEIAIRNGALDATFPATFPCGQGSNSPAGWPGRGRGSLSSPPATRCWDGPTAGPRRPTTSCPTRVT